MQTLAPNTNGSRVRPWRALALLLAATAVGASESPGSEAAPSAGVPEPITSASEPVAPAIGPVTGATQPITGATEPVGRVTEPAARATELITRATQPITAATEPLARATEPVAQAAEPVARVTKPVHGSARQPIPNARPLIGRFFFTPAERRSRRGGDGPAATSAAMPEAPAARRHSPAPGRLVVNGALNSSTQGLAVWVNGSAVDNSARERSAWTDRNGNVWLVNGDHGIRLVRPGQSIDSSGVIQDLLPPGAVTRR